VATSLYPAGLGGTVDMIALNEPYYGLDSVAWYVHSPTGVDGAAPLGRDKQKPLRSIFQAVENASANDVIIALDGHVESNGVTLHVNKRGLVIVGCGQTAGVPNVTMSVSDYQSSMIAIDSPYVQLRNIRLVAEGATPNTNQGVVVNAAGFVLDGCWFDCSETFPTTAMRLAVGADGASLRDTTFISRAAMAEFARLTGLASNAPIQGLHLQGVVFSDGTAGFTSGYACDFSLGAITDLRVDSVSLLLGASMRVNAATTGYIIPTVTGGGVIDI
jgi:hypothetical protein